MRHKRLFYGVLMIALVACGQRTEETTSTQSSTETSTMASSTTETSATDTSTTTDTATATTATAAETSASDSKDKVAELHTTAGEIHIRFFPDVAPNHVKNFLTLAGQGFYDGTKFHRVIPGFVIQGGDPNSIRGDPNTWGMGGSPTRLEAEFNRVLHKRGIVSMARSNDPNSASSQFFIVVADSPNLDNQYSVFGQVTKGMDVADKIVSAPTGPANRPNNPTTITRIVIRDARDNEKGPAPR